MPFLYRAHEAIYCSTSLLIVPATCLLFCSTELLSVTSITKQKFYFPINNSEITTNKELSVWHQLFSPSEYSWNLQNNWYTKTLDYSVCFLDSYIYLYMMMIDSRLSTTSSGEFMNLKRQFNKHRALPYSFNTVCLITLMHRNLDSL